MILLSTIAVTNNQFKLISLWINFPIRIGQDEDNNPIFVVARHARLKDRNILKVKLLSLFICAVFQLCNGLWHLPSPRLHTEEKVLVALFSFCIPCVALALTTSLYQNPADVATLLNMILAYERRAFNRFLKWALRLLGLYEAIFIQIFMILLVIMKVGKPPFLGSIIPGRCRLDSFICIIRKFIFLIIFECKIRYRCMGRKLLF